MTTTPSPQSAEAQEREAKWRKKPVVVTASQWFKNGDHPQDYAETTHGFENGELRAFSGEYRKARDWEGGVVRYYRHPDVLGSSACEQCGKTHQVHGWIDTLEQGHRVCPGDWIITGVKGERYPCKPDIFAATYERASLPSAAASGEASAVQEVEAGWAALIHYPKHWDTTAYPTLESAVSEALSWAGCSACKDPKAYGIDDPTPAVEGLTDEQIDDFAQEHLGSVYNYYAARRFARALLAASPVAMASSAGEALLKLLNHIEDVVDDSNWEKIDPKLWNAVTSQFATPPSTYGTEQYMRGFNDAKAQFALPAASLREQEDAARYRWLRRCRGQEHDPLFTVQHELDGTLWGGDLDAAIDAARKEAQ
jgi:hypothetical protein